MKFLIIFLLFLNFKSYSQIASISINNNNFVYQGLDNHLTIAVSNFSEDELKVKTNNGVISGKDGQYILNPDSAGVCYLTIEVETNGITKTIATYPIRVKKIDKTFATLGGQFLSGDLKLNEFKVQQGVIIRYDYQYNICGYIKTTNYKVMIAKNKTGQFKLFENLGASFTPEVQNEIKKLEPQDIIILFEIQGDFLGKKITPENQLIFVMK